MLDWKNKRVLVTGGHGFVGHALLNGLKNKECKEIIAPTSKECDLTIEVNVKKLIKETKPNIVIHLAGQVGGIAANKAAPGQFFYNNIMMGTLILENARIYGAEKLIALAAGCGYPKNLDVPFKESEFWDGLPDGNSIGYSMAKKMLIIQSWTYREQYGFNSSILLPANLYGPNDNFDLEESHVIPALIRKFVEAENNSNEVVTIWGSGLASREFLYVEDVMKAIIKVVEEYNESGPLNLGTGTTTSIKELVKIIADITGFNGKIIWDKTRPDGQIHRYFDMSMFKNNLGHMPYTSLKEGLIKTINWYRNNSDNNI